MRYLALVVVLFASLSFAGECCGDKKAKVVNVHDVEGVACGENEVMVGHDMEAGVVKCGTVAVQCCSPCNPEQK